MKQLSTVFTSYEFSDEEKLKIYKEVSFDFLCLLQTRRAELATARIHADLDPKDIYSFIQTEASLHSAIHELGLLIQSIELAKSQSESQEY